MRTKFTPAAEGAKTGETHAAANGWLPRSPIVAGLAAVAGAGLLAACSSGNGSATAASGAGGGQQGTSAVTVSTRPVSGIGTVLTNQSGMTLYTPKQEASGTIKCTGGCTSFWFPVTIAKGASTHAAGSLPGTLSSIQRPDGSVQLTYNGEPLYTFRLDTGPGQAHGNNFTDSFGGQAFLWHAATASASAPASGRPTSPSGYGNSMGGGGGY
jgi:predicted lipoprotein with Yx(FWY)xxD motif